MLLLQKPSKAEIKTAKKSIALAAAPPHLNRSKSLAVSRKYCIHHVYASSLEGGGMPGTRQSTK